MDTGKAQAVIQDIVKNVMRVMVGKQMPIELSVIALLCRGHVLVEDVPGVGKTMLVSALARSIDCPFRRIQFTPDIMPSDITGFSLYSQKTGEFEYRPGLVLTSFLLADEINRATPKTQSSLLEAMEEHQVTVDGHSYALPEPFMVMATQNPMEYIGTYPLPEAQLDRFLMRIDIGYPEPRQETQILRRFKEENPLHSLNRVATGEQILAFQELVREIYVEDSLYDYIVAIVKATREHPDVELGSSPRGSLGLMRAAQALALYQGRSFVVPDDIRPLVIPVLAHRLMLRQSAMLRKVTPGDILTEIVGALPVPRGPSS